ncbi:MAG: hypothetical protein WCI04_06360 [archaeon]
MVFVSRKIAYPFFTVIILTVFFLLLYVGFFSNALYADIGGSSVSIVGDQIVIKIPVENKSNHVINDILVTVNSDKRSSVLPLKGDYNSTSLLPGEKYTFSTSIPLGESYSYVAVISAPFDGPITINIPLDPETVDPVRAELFLPKSMILGREYNYSVKLCNVSPNELGEVFWIENALAGNFKETFFERSVPLNKAECKTIYSTLTPIKLGDISMNFSLRVGELKKDVSTIISVSVGDSNR